MYKIEALEFFRMDFQMNFIRVQSSATLSQNKRKSIDLNITFLTIPKTNLV